MVSTHLKNMFVKLDHETPSRDEHKQIFELPPPRIHSRRLVTSPCKAKAQLSFSSPPPQLTRIPGEIFVWHEAADTKKHQLTRWKNGGGTAFKELGKLGKCWEWNCFYCFCAISSFWSSDPLIFHRNWWETHGLSAGYKHNLAARTPTPLWFSLESALFNTNRSSIESKYYHDKYLDSKRGIAPTYFFPSTFSLYVAYLHPAHNWALVKTCCEGFDWLPPPHWRRDHGHLKASCDGIAAILEWDNSFQCKEV